MRRAEEGERETLGGGGTTGEKSYRVQGRGEMRGGVSSKNAAPRGVRGRQAKEGRHAVGETKTKNLNGNHERMIWNQI